MGKEYSYWFDKLRPASLGQYCLDIHFVTLFRNLLQNERFRRDFIDAFCIMGGSVFEKNRAATIIDSVRNVLYPMMQLSWESPNNTANTLISSLNSRMSSMTNHLANYNLMKLSGIRAQAVKITTNNPTGRLYINNTLIPTSSFDGNLFAPVTLRAEAPAGYKFRGWKNTDLGSIYSTSSDIVMPDGNFSLEAVFEADGEHPVCPVRINEVAASNDVFISDYYKRSDWLELYNTTDQPIDIEGWTLINDGDKLQRSVIKAPSLKSQTVIPAHGYLIVWCDKNAPVDQLHADFKLAASGGRLMLQPADQSWMDTFYYPEYDVYSTAGRYPDGTDHTYIFQRPTIGTSNMLNIYATAYVDKGSTTEAINTSLMAARQLNVRAVADRLVLRSTAASNATVSIYKTSGQLVLTADANVVAGKAEISTTDLPSGYYIAKVTTNDGQSTTCKFIK
jgi:hypothetical protein